MKEAIISLYHDTRRELEDKTFPVKIRAYFQKAKMYETGISLTEEEFANAHKPKPRGEAKENNIKLQAVLSKAISTAKELRVFSFDKFEKELFRAKSSVTNVIDHYEDYIAILDEQERIGSASNYRCSLNSILAFVNEDHKNPVSKISFENITSEFLNKYEKWMLAKGRSKSTIGIYLRPLRAIFNLAIENGDIDREIYPFRKYSIPAGRNIKKNLESDVLKALFTAELPEGSHLEKARDFWFFSYQCNGMNFRDIAELKFKNFTNTYFSFLRQKTINTIKDDPTPIVVPITEHIRNFLEVYANKNGKPNDYVFPIFSEGMSAKDKHRANQNFIRYVNQHMKTLAESKGVTFNLGTMYARHSFTTKVTREIGLEFAQEALGHTSLATTQNYWAGFESKTKKEMADKLLDFD
jgi:integrase/recombinase XerD